MDYSQYVDERGGGGGGNIARVAACRVGAESRAAYDEAFPRQRCLGQGVGSDETKGARMSVRACKLGVYAVKSDLVVQSEGKK